MSWAPESPPAGVADGERAGFPVVKRDSSSLFPAGDSPERGFAPSGPLSFLFSSGSPEGTSAPSPLRTSQDPPHTPPTMVGAPCPLRHSFLSSQTFAPPRPPGSHHTRTSPSFTGHSRRETEASGGPLPSFPFFSFSFSPASVPQTRSDTQAGARGSPPGPGLLGSHGGGGPAERLPR